MTQRPLPDFLTSSADRGDDAPPPAAIATDKAPRSRAAWWALAVLLITAAAFAIILRNGFAWDDDESIYKNPRYQPATFSSILSYWTTRPQADFYYYPVTTTVWGILARFFAFKNEQGWVTLYWPFHLVSIVVHSLSAVVIFLILHRLFERPLSAFIGALLFALHPVQVETVAWASGLKDLLCGLFSFLSILQYIRSRQATSTRSAAVAYTLATVCFVLAALSKPTAVILPLIIAGLDLLVLNARALELLKRLGPWLLAAIAFAILNASFLQTPVPHQPPLWARPLIAGDALAFYLVKLIIPLPLAPDYGRIPPRALEQWTIYIAWAIPVVFAIILFLARRQFPRLAAAGLIFLIGLLPTLGFVPFAFQEYSTVADHYLYIPMLGVAIAAAWLLDRYRNIAALGIAAAALVVLAALTIRQATVWRTEGGLWQHTLRVNPRSVAALNNLGLAFASAGREDLAAAHFSQALKLRPEFTQARRNLDAYVNQKRTMSIGLIGDGQSALAIPHLRAALRYERQISQATALELRFLLGVALVASDHIEAGLEELFNVQKANPGYPDIHRAIDLALERQRAAATQPAEEPPRTRPRQ